MAAPAYDGPPDGRIATRVVESMIGSTAAPRLTAIALSAALAAFAWAWRTNAVGGSDSACYALMTRMFVEGRLQPVSELALDAPWPDGTRVAAPAGFLPSESRPGAAVPVCAPGYAAVVTPLWWVLGPTAVHAAPALAAGLIAWCAFLLGRRLHGSWTGVAAAALVASHPLVLFQAVQPMNDIATGALWLGVAVAMCAGRAALTGVLAGIGLLVRPNLALAGAAAIIGVAMLPPPNAGERGPALFIRRLVIAGAAAAPGVLAALAFNALLYGSPMRSGYGDLGVLFSAANVPHNLVSYGATWLRTSTPAVLLALVAPLIVAAPARRGATLCLALAAALSAVYFAYRPFDEWWYLRFLLPAVALSLVLAAVSVVGLLQRVSPRAAPVLGAIVVGVIAVHALTGPETREALRLRALEGRFRSTAQLVATQLGPTAVPITLWQSGGLRFWPGNEVVVWDALDPQWLDRAVAWLEAHGRAPVIVVEGSEEGAFRARFDGQAMGALDWPPRFDVDRRVRVFLPADRDRYQRGDAVTTQAIFSSR